MSSLRILALAVMAGWVAVVAQAFTVVIDPGHGGHDPGAEAEGVREADLVLSMAERLAGELQAPDVTVILTRPDDAFVPLGERVEIARRAKADLLISIHADSLGEGRASGLSVYRFDPAKSARTDASRRVTRPVGDWLATAPLSADTGDLGPVMMEMARSRTTPASARLSAHMIAAFRGADLRLAGRPERQKGFTVLTSAETPSVLVELGFLSSDRDRARLTSPEWQARAARAMAEAITKWRNDAVADFDG